MTMTTASVTETAQQIRDRLLQATDAQCNISNMMAVREVISILEKLPITKEALEETRLGKLINDLRKKTRDEDLAKRAKKLLRSWQKLIDPQQEVVLPKEASCTLNHAVGSNGPQSLPVFGSPQSVTNNDRKPVLHHIYPLHCTDKFFPIKHTGKQSVENNLTTLKCTKRSALSTDSKSSSGGPEDLKIYASAIKPQFSSPELNKEPTASTILRNSVLQQQGQMDITAIEKVKYKSHSHHSNPSPRLVKKIVPSKQPTLISDTESEPLSVLPKHSSIKSMHTDCLQDLSHSKNESLLSGERTLELINNLQNKSNGLTRLQPGLLSEVTNKETEKELKPLHGKRRTPQLKDYDINTEGHLTDDVCKSARVKNRKLTFDPLTLQIRPSAVNQSEVQHNPTEDGNEPVNIKQSSSASSPSTLHKMNWKDMSQNKIVKYYLNLQNNLLKTSGNQVPEAHMFMNEVLKSEEDNMREANRTYVQVQNVTENNLPGIDREVTTEDVHKINNKHWPGVNGCYNSRGQWYSWTECISLDMYGDGSKLNILPYVCID